MKKNFKIFLPLLFLLIICLIYFLPIFTNPGKILHGQDFSVIYYWKDFIKQELSSFRLPLWNPNDRTGFPYFANPNVAIWYPSNLLFLLLPVHFALNFTFFIHVFLTLIFSYLFAKSLKLATIPSLTVAVAFAFSGFLPMRIYSGHREIIESLPYIPALFLFLNKYFSTQKIKFLIFGSLCLGLQLLAGNPTWAVYTLEAAFIFTIFIPIKNIKFRLFSFIKLLILGISLSAIQIIPFLELSALSTRAFSFSFEQSVIGSFPLKHLITFLFPFFYKNPLIENYVGAPTFWELCFFPGIVVLFLSSASLLAIRKNYYFTRVFLIIIAVIFIISLGNNTPLYRILWDISVFYQKTRFPARHLILFAFSLSLLAGIGSQLFKKKIFQLIFLALIIIELFNFGKPFIQMEDPKSYRGDGKLFTFLSTDKSLFRLYATYDLYSWMRLGVSEFNTPFLYNIATLKAYDSSILKSYHDFTNSIQNISWYGEVDTPLTNISSPVLNFLNAKYFLTPSDANLDKEYPKRFKKIISDPSYQLFENMDNQPRFSLEPGNKGEVKVEKYLPTEIILSVKTDRDALLSSSEIYYPGWHSQIDGKETGFNLINNTFRGIDIPKGNHVVKWYFLPYSLLLGSAISLLSLAICIISVVKFRK